MTYVGRLETQKGVRWLVETAPAWLGQLPDCDLLLVGKGPEREHLRRMSADRGIADRVHFAGWRSDVPAILARSDLVVLPSAWEGMPNVVLEAMASRLPVVASNVEGVAELLGPDADAQTVAHGDTTAFAAKVVGIMTDRGVGRRLGGQEPPPCRGGVQPGADGFGVRGLVGIAGGGAVKNPERFFQGTCGVRRRCNSVAGRKLGRRAATQTIMGRENPA